MFDFHFLQDVGISIPWSEFAAKCWNLALIYVAWDIIKWFDVKMEKIMRRLRSNERG